MSSQSPPEGYYIQTTVKRHEELEELLKFFPKEIPRDLHDKILGLGINRLMEEHIDKQATSMVPVGIKDCLVIEPGGASYLRKPAFGTAYTLEELQQIVGGYIEQVTLVSGHWLMFCNEEGKIKGLPMNAEASAITGDNIVGTVLFCTNGRVL